jgi:PLP dependent protein
MDELLVSAIRARLERVRSQIADTALGSGRQPGEIRLVTVTKSQPLAVVQAAIAAGADVLGENYAEEAVTKISSLAEFAVEWHMIGHVQSRKADLVAGHFSMLHSLDSLKLAGRLDRFCAGLGRILPVLLEFNVSGEQSKFGFPAWEEQHWPYLVPEVESLLQYPNLRIRGLMTMPPFFADPEQTRPYFKRLRRLQEFLRQRFPQTVWKELSMGTSVDFISAVQEGASLVRVGQAILGVRPG